MWCLSREIHISRVKNNSSRLLRVSTSNGSVHFYPAFKVIFSLPVSLYRHYLQQRDQFLALKVSRNHSQNQQQGIITNKRCFLQRRTSYLRRLCLWERFKLVNQLENFPRKVSFWLRKVLWRPLWSSANSTVLFKFSNRQHLAVRVHTNNRSFLDC